MNKLILILVTACGVGAWFHFTKTEEPQFDPAIAVEQERKRQFEAAYRSSSAYDQPESVTDNFVNKTDQPGVAIDPDSYAAMMKQAQQMANEAQQRQLEQQKKYEEAMQAMNPGRSTDGFSGFSEDRGYSSRRSDEERKLQRELQMKRNLQYSKWRRERHGITSKTVSNIDVCYVMYKKDPDERAACIKRLSTVRSKY